MGGVDISHAYFILIEKSRFMGKLVGTLDFTFISLILKDRSTLYRNDEHI